MAEVAAAENERRRLRMHWQALLAIEMGLTVGAVWLGHYRWVCGMVAFLRLAALVFEFIAGCR
jgi:hypothetical protein